MDTQGTFELSLMRICAYCKSGAPCESLMGEPQCACMQTANHPKQPKTVKGRKAVDGIFVPVMDLGGSCDKWSPVRFDSPKAAWLRRIGLV